MPASQQKPLVSATAATSAPISDSKKAATAPATPTAAQASEIPRFRLALFHYGSLGLCLSLDTADKLPRRFCDDLARSFGGNIDAVKYHQLEWPMLSTSGIDQSIKAAREVVTQKFRLLPPMVLVFGQDVAEYYPPLDTLEAFSPGRVGPQQFLLIPSLSEFMRSGVEKKRLLLTMQAQLPSRQTPQSTP